MMGLRRISSVIPMKSNGLNDTEYLVENSDLS